MEKFVLVVCFVIAVVGLCVAAVMLIRMIVGFVAALYMLGKLLVKLICHKYKSRTNGYKKELPFDTVCLRLVSGMSEILFESDDKKVRPLGKRESRGFVFFYERRYEATKNRKEMGITAEDNREKLWKLKKAFAKDVAGKDPCLFVTHASYHKPCHYADSRSDTFNLSNDERLAEWLSNQQQIVSRENVPVAVRGIDGGTMKILREFGEVEKEGFHELIVPKISEQELKACKIDDLLMYHEIENCKFKINNCGGNGMYFEFSGVPGYTKEDLIQRARELAESMGYKFKVKELEEDEKR